MTTTPMTGTDHAVGRTTATDTAIDKPRQRAIHLLETQQYEAAVAVLEEAAHDDPSASTEGLLGTAYYLCERYDDAAQHLRRAVEGDPANVEWRAKLAIAAANATTRVGEDYPPVLPFDAAVLLAAPKIEPGTIPSSSHGPISVTPRQRALQAAGRATGMAASAVMGVATRFAGLLGDSDEIWTNWYRKPLALAVATLGYMRERLDTVNLVDPYPKGELTAFQSRGLVAPPGVLYSRTPDGSWNNLSNPKEGAAGVRFPRNVSRAAGWPESGPRLLTPNPLEISRTLLARGPEGIKTVPFLNMLAAAWIQFMVHDWVSHQTSRTGGVHEIPVPLSHPARREFHQTKMFVPKTVADPTRSVRDEGIPPTFINEVTSWWDASQIYGSDHATALSLRSLADGKLKLDARGHLPIGKGDIEHVGFNRNWWVGVALMHTVFVREHNAICDMLKKHYPAWDDNRLYNVARLVNAALIAKIHTVEWTPAILPNRALYLAMNANWYGIAEMALHPHAPRTLRQVKIQEPAIGGIVGNPIDRHGEPYGLSEEFSEVYRLHELLPDELTVRSRADGAVLELVGLAHSRQAGSHRLTDRYGLEDLLYSFGNQQPGQLVLNNFPSTLRELSVPGNPVFDMAAVDILRARERGVPRYNEFRRQLGMKPIHRFEDLTSDPEQLAALKHVYGNDVELIDMHVGSRAESTRPTGFGFGETLFQIFILNASRRLQADRFFTDSYNADTYTQEGLDWIDASTFKGVLLRHYPDLATTGLANVVNAFEPWDTGELDPARHPLKAFY